MTAVSAAVGLVVGDVEDQPDLTVQPLDGATRAWDEFVRRAPGSSFCHLAGWRDILTDTLGAECFYWVAVDDRGQWQGVLPLARVKSRIFGDYLVSMPFLNYGGPLGSESAVRALVVRAVSQAREDGVDLLELRSRESVPVQLPVSHRKITCLLDLVPGDAESVWQRLTSNMRRKVRRAQKEGLSVRFGFDEIGPFYEVFCRHMRDLGTPTLPRRFFESLVERFPDDIWVGCVYHEGRPVAGACGFQWAGELELTWVSALRAYHRIYANMLLYWAFIERAANQGLSLFNFGRCTPGGGTHHFKQQWGARDVALMWYQPVIGRRGSTPSPQERTFAWGPAVWKRLPLLLTNALGPSIARLIP